MQQMWNTFTYLTMIFLELKEQLVTRIIMIGINYLFDFTCEAYNPPNEIQHFNIIYMSSGQSSRWHVVVVYKSYTLIYEL